MAQGDIRLSLVNGEGSLSIVNGDVGADTGLETCILISLFTDARAGADDTLPDNSLNKRGWWGDSFLEASLGSKLWLLSRASIIPSILDDAAKYAKSCLQWLIEDGIVDSVDVSVTRTDMQTLHIQINVTRPKGESNVVFKYFYNWQNQLLR